MDFERLNGDIKEMRRRNRGLGLAVGVLAAGQILALVVILNLLGTVRTVVVPPSINKTFWVTRDKASSEYLEQMGSFIAWLVLDVTPASIDWKKDILLGYVEPEQYGPLKTRQEVEAERLKRINAATVFMPQQLVPSEEGQSVVIRGRLRTLVNGFETANDLKAYRVEFSYAGGAHAPEEFQGGTQCRQLNQPKPDPRASVRPWPRHGWAMSAAIAARPPSPALTAVPAQALQVVEASDGVAVEAILSIKEPTRIRIDGAPITDVFGNIHSSIAARRLPFPPRRA
jgi:conjugal transfer pilus assembly protein TraE